VSSSAMVVTPRRGGLRPGGSGSRGTSRPRSHPAG
jgi:hypothetical protein